MEHIPTTTSPENGLSAYLDELTAEFTNLWQKAKFDSSDDSSEYSDLVRTIQSTEGAEELLFHALERITTVDSHNTHQQLSALIEAISVSGDPDIMEWTLDLLRDDTSPLWQSRTYFDAIERIALDVPYDVAAQKILGIAIDVHSGATTGAERYRNHTAKLARLVDLVASDATYELETEKRDSKQLEAAQEQNRQSGTTNAPLIAMLSEESSENIRELDLQLKMLLRVRQTVHELRAALRPALLAEIALQPQVEQDSKIPGVYHSKHFEEASAFPLSPDSQLDNLLTIYNLKAVTSLDTGTYENSTEPDFPELIGRHNLRELEAHPHAATVPIGIELEVPLKALPLEEFHDKPADEQALSLEVMKNRYFQTEYAGIPSDNNDLISFHEFSFNPANHYLTLTRQVQMLQERGYISDRVGSYAIHINVADIDASLDENRENGAFTLCRAIEATGWSTTSCRLLRNYPKSVKARQGTEVTVGWDCKGLAGVLDKHRDEFYDRKQPYDLVEFRTFRAEGLPDLSRLNRTLASFQTLGTALAAAKKVSRLSAGEASEAGPLPEGSHQLAAFWHQFAGDIDDLFTAYGLERPASPYLPLQPENDTKGRYVDLLKIDVENRPSGFVRLAELIREHENIPASAGAEFVNEARRIVTKASHQVAPIIFPRGSERERQLDERLKTTVVRLGT